MNQPEPGDHGIGLAGDGRIETMLGSRLDDVVLYRPGRSEVVDGDLVCSTPEFDLTDHLRQRGMDERSSPSRYRLHASGFGPHLGGEPRDQLEPRAEVGAPLRVLGQLLGYRGEPRKWPSLGRLTETDDVEAVVDGGRGIAAVLDAFRAREVDQRPDRVVAVGVDDQKAREQDWPGVRVGQAESAGGVLQALDQVGPCMLFGSGDDRVLVAGDCSAQQRPRVAERGDLGGG